MEKIKILVCCGSGIATSTVIANRVKTICAENGYNAEITQVKIIEVEKLAKDFDLVVSSTVVPNIQTPSVFAISYLTGIDKEKTDQEILDKLKNK